MVFKHKMTIDSLTNRKHENQVNIGALYVKRQLNKQYMMVSFFNQITFEHHTIAWESFCLTNMGYLYIILILKQEQRSS